MGARDWLEMLVALTIILGFIGGVVRLALKAQLNEFKLNDLAPLSKSLGDLTHIAQSLAREMSDARVSQREDRDELHGELEKMRDFHEKLESRVNGHDARLGMLEAKRPRITPARGKT